MTDYSAEKVLTAHMSPHAIVTSLVADGEHAKATEVWGAHLADLYVANPTRGNLRAIRNFRADLATDGPESVMVPIASQIDDAAA